MAIVLIRINTINTINTCWGPGNLEMKTRRSFSDHAPALIDCAVIISNIYDVTDDLHQNERTMGVPIRGYVATATQVHRKAWGNQLHCVMFSEHL